MSRTSLAPAVRVLKGHPFAWNFQVWVSYLRIMLRMSYRLIPKAVFDLFSEQLPPEAAMDFVERFSEC